MNLRVLIAAAILAAAAALFLRSSTDERDRAVEGPRLTDAAAVTVDRALTPTALDSPKLDDGGAARELLETRVPTPFVQPSGTSIRGTVITVDGRPAPGITVAVYGKDGGPNPLSRVKSGEDGAFDVDGLDEGTYWLGASESGAGAIQTEVDVPDGESVHGVHVIVYGAKILTGHLRGPGGEPVAGAKVYLDVPSEKESAYLRWNSPSRSTITDENGAFRFDDAPRLPIELGVYPSDYTTEVVSVAPDVEAVDVTFRGKEEVAIVLGRVLDPSGAPIAGARVEETGLHRTSKGTTDDAGAFSFESIISGEPDAPRTAAVEAWAQGFAPVRVEFPVKDGQAGPVDVRLRDAYTLEGTVVDASGDPIRAGLTLYEAGKSLHEPSLIRFLDARFQKATAKDGFRIEHLWGAEFDVVVQVGSDTHSIHRLDPRDGPFVLGPNSDSLEIRFEVTATDAITGAALERYSLGTYGKGGGGSRGGTWEGGVARDSEKGPATLEVRVRADGYAHARVRKRHYEPGTYRIAFPLLPVRAVRLRVVDQAGLPWSGLRVRFPEAALGDGEFAPVTLSGGGTTELDGRCWLDHVPVTTDALEIFDASGEALLLIYPLGAQSPSSEQTVVVK
jgi:hypothetical protein